MKRLLPALALLLLLSSCSMPQNQPSPSASGPVSPSPALSPAPSPSEAPGEWWEQLSTADLPTVPATADAASQSQCLLLGTLPEEDVALYGSPDPKGGIVLRRGTCLQYFPQTYTALSYQSGLLPLPDLYWNDFDGDGASELAVKYFVDADGGRTIYELHIYEWEDQFWTDHILAPALYQPEVDSLLGYHHSANSSYITITLGRASATAWAEGSPTGLRGVGDLVFFRYEEGAFTAVFGIQVDTEEGTPLDVAIVTAKVSYDGDNISLDHYQIQSLGGV